MCCWEGKVPCGQEGGIRQCVRLRTLTNKSLHPPLPPQKSATRQASPSIDILTVVITLKCTPQRLSSPRYCQRILFNYQFPRVSVSGRHIEMKLWWKEGVGVQHWKTATAQAHVLEASRGGNRGLAGRRQDSQETKKNAGMQGGDR